MPPLSLRLFFLSSRLYQIILMHVEIVMLVFNSLPSSLKFIDPVLSSPLSS